MEKAQVQHELLISQKDEMLKKTAKDNEDLRKTIKQLKEHKLASEMKELKLL